MAPPDERRTPGARQATGGQSGSILDNSDDDIITNSVTHVKKLTTSHGWAVRLAAMGFRIFPLPPCEKAPAVRWRDIATTDPDQINTWFADDPDINYGVCPDERHAVVDLDDKGDKNGVAEFFDLGLENGDIVQTFSVVTPSGGKHLYFKVPHSVGNGNTFPDGIDVRGHGGYVVGPGSVINGKPYEAQSDEIVIVPAPPWVLNRMRRRGERDEKRRTEALFELDLPAAVSLARDFLATRTPAVEGHGGDEHTYVTACRVKDFGISENKAFELLMEPGGWNDRCEPPWDGADLKIKVANAYSYGSERPGAKGGSLMELMGDDEVQDVAERFRQNASNDDEPDAEQPSDRRARKPLFTFDQAFLAVGSALYLISEWLPDRGVVACLAARGLGKTVTILDLAMSLACDMDWQGQPSERDLWSIYMAGEDSEGAMLHARAWLKHHDIDNPKRFIFAPECPDLLSADDCRAWTEDILSMLPDGVRAVLFIDTWQRATSRGRQNDDEDMQLAVHHAEAMARSLGGPALISFHPPKDGRAVVMGSSVIENSTTAIWNISEPGAGIKRVEVTRIKGRGVGNRRDMRFEVIGLDEHDSLGQELTGLVPVALGGTELKRRKDEEKAAVAGLIRQAVAAYDVEGRDPAGRDTDFSVNKVAKRLAGQRVDVDGGTIKLDGHSSLRAKLPRMFKWPYRFDDGAELSLERAGSGRVFRLK